MQHSDLAEDVLLPKHVTLHVFAKELVGYTDKGQEIHRFIGSAEIVDVQGEKIDISAIAEVMPTMEDQGRRINGFHATQPAGHFTDWGLTKLDDIPAIWLDVAVYDVYPSQKENLRRLHLPDGDPEKIRGLSIGGKRLEKHRECNDQYCYVRTTKLEGWEWSLVDKPANPLALRTEELGMAITKSLQKSEKANSQGRTDKGKFSKDHDESDCKCKQHTEEKKEDKITKVKCVECSNIHEHVEKAYDDDEEEEGSSDEEIPEDEGMADDEYPEDEGMEENPDEEMAGEEEVPEPEADVEKPMGEGYPEEEGMPEEMPSVNEGGNDMQEKIGYITMQLDKLMTALNIEKAEVTPEKYVDDQGNVYLLQKGVTEEKTPDEIIKGLEAKVAELTASQNQTTVQSGSNDIAKHDAGNLSGTQASNPEADIRKMDIAERLTMVKLKSQSQLRNNRIQIQQ